MRAAWVKVADMAIGGLTEVGFVPGTGLLLVISHQGRGVVDLVTGACVARDQQETGGWFDATRPAALGIGPASGRWVEVAGLAGGRLPVISADGWQARLTASGVALSGPAGEAVAIDEPEEIHAFGFSPDGQALVVGSSPSLMIFRRDKTPTPSP